VVDMINARRCREGCRRLADDLAVDRGDHLVAPAIEGGG
jgi:hypothetical protein